MRFVRFSYAVKAAVLLSLVSLAFRLTPESAHRIFEERIALGFFESFFGHLVLTTALFLCCKLWVLMSNKPQERLDAQGFPEYIGPATRLSARAYRHLAVIAAMHQGVEETEDTDGFDRSPAAALRCFFFPFGSSKYRRVAELINADKFFPFHRGTVAPKVNGYNQAVITGYSRHLARYFETVGTDLGFTVTTFHPETLPSISRGASPYDPLLGEIQAKARKVRENRWVRFLSWIGLEVASVLLITAFIEHPASILYYAATGLLFGLLILDELTGGEPPADVKEALDAIEQRLALDRSNLIIDPNGQQWHALAAQILAITDYTHQQTRPREEALARIELVLRSNIFQVEDKNLTPEEAYEWARAELYDSSAVSVAYPNGYSAATAPADQEDAR